MTSADALQILGLTPAASPSQIRRAYRKLALVWHPDRHATNPQRRKQAEERFKGISAAYQHLKEWGPSDAASRQPPPPAPAGDPYAHRRRAYARAPSAPATPAAALPEVPWWARPVGFREVFIVYGLLRLASCMTESPPYRLTEPPPIPEISDQR
jgi:hypothetical protein